MELHKIKVNLDQDAINRRDELVDVLRKPDMEVHHGRLLPGVTHNLVVLDQAVRLKQLKPYLLFQFARLDGFQPSGELQGRGLRAGGAARRSAPRHRA